MSPSPPSPHHPPTHTKHATNTKQQHHDTYPPTSTSTSSSSKSKSSSSKKRSHSYDKLDHYPDSDLPSPSQLARSLPPWLASTIHRAESASKNNIESIPLFATAVLASLIAERIGGAAAPAAASGGFLASFTQAVGTTTESGRVDTGLRIFVAGWFALRTVYTIAYVKTESQKWSYVRSVVWAAGCGLVGWQTWRAAVLLG